MRMRNKPVLIFFCLLLSAVAVLSGVEIYSELKERQKEKQTFETANRIESKIAGEGFEVHRLKKPEIKRILALYFDSSLQGEAIPDIDGEQFYEVTDDEDEE